MSNGIVWQDEDGMDRITDAIQEMMNGAVTTAVTDYVSSGFLCISPGTLDVAFIAADPLDEVEKLKPLTELIQDELQAYINFGHPYGLKGVLSYDFGDDARCVKLQAALRCLL